MLTVSTGVVVGVDAVRVVLVLVLVAVLVVCVAIGVVLVVVAVAIAVVARGGIVVWLVLGIGVADTGISRLCVRRLRSSSHAESCV